MTLGIDMNLLTAYYQARSGVSGGLAYGGAGSAGGPKKNPTPPWTASSTAPKMSALTQTVLQGGKFINEGAAQLDAPKASADYRRLFALYQGLNALEGVVEQMNVKGIGDFRKNELRARFDAGMKEISEYLDKTKFDGFLLAQGVVGDKLQSAGLIKRETDTYTTVPLHNGAVDAEVQAFQGPTAFSLKLTKPSGAAIDVNFDLAEMGSTPRTMANVVIYMNDKLEAAGSYSRFGIQRDQGAERTVQAGKETIKLGPGPDTFSLKFKGVSTEVATFSAAATPSVYIGETSGKTGNALVKFATDPASGATGNVDGKVFTKALGDTMVTVRASAVAADGSVYVLGDERGKPDGQAVKGMTDAVLRKYDSAGNLVFTRTLGAQQDASGYALTVSADGSRVAIAGSVTGALDRDETFADAKTPDSFVTVFDAEGEELFTQRRGATAADQVNAMTFGDDGTLYVAGSTSSGIGGQASLGQQDGYIQAFKPNASPTAASAYNQAFTVQYGTAGTDKVSGIAVQGSTLVVAGLENGDVVARRYDLQATGAPTLGAVRNLGGVNGGTVAGVGFADDGSVVLAGSTHNGALNAGSVTTAYTSGQAAFVAKLSGDLGAGAGEKLTYYNGASDLTASAMTVAGGKVYVTGQTKVAPPPGQTTAFDGFAAAIDADSGAVSWSQTFRGDERLAGPTSISVDTSGASVLDRLGLPKGTIDYEKSQTVVANTSARPGDQFFVRVGGLAKAVTIEAGDTLKNIATKINRAAGFNVKAEVISADGFDKLKITPVSSRTAVELEAGPDGRNALSALGLVEGLATTATDKNTKDKIKASYALQLPSTLNLDTDGYAKQAQAVLLTAMSTIKSIYKDMTYDPATAVKTGTVPAYLQNQIASYQQALSRLTGGG